MTREEILKLEAGPETDALVAEVMGAERLKVRPDPPLREIVYVGLGRGYQFIPLYSSDIGAAWEVFIRFYYPSLWRDGDCWTCALHRDIDSKRVVAFADTAPLAICRAALLAVMEENQ